MWTKENRGRYDRNRLCQPGDLTDEERALVMPLIAPVDGGGGKRTHRYAQGGRRPDGGAERWQSYDPPCSDGVGASHNQSAETSHGH